jgi:hypothetical protein
VDRWPVRDGTREDRWRRGRPVEETLLEGAVVEVGRQGPAEADLDGPLDVAADGGPRQSDRDACLARAQALGEAESQGFSDLAHGSTGTGHRHLSWGDVNAFQASVTGPGRLTSALLTTYPRGWPLPVKQGGQFRRNRVAICRETGWPKPVKSAASRVHGLEGGVDRRERHVPVEEEDLDQGPRAAGIAEAPAGPRPELLVGSREDAGLTGLVGHERTRHRSRLAGMNRRLVVRACGAAGCDR